MLVNCEIKSIWYIIFRILVWRDNLYLKIWNRKYNFRKFEYNVFSKGASDTLFILGNGTSIKQLDDKKWSIIKQHFSVGVNLWLLHDFIPDCYSVELSKDAPEGYLLTRSEILSSKLRNTSSVSFLLHPRGVHPDTFPIPKEFFGKTFIYRPCQSLSHSVKFPRYAIQRVIRWTCGHYEQDICFGDGASIERIISLAIKARKKKIILVGIDLNTSSSFYTNNNHYLAQLGGTLPDTAKQKTTLHKTADSSQKRITVLDTVPLLAIYAREHGVDVLVENPGSALAAELTVLDWSTLE